MALYRVITKDFFLQSTSLLFLRNLLLLPRKDDSVVFFFFPLVGSLSKWELGYLCLLIGSGNHSIT